MTETTNLAPSEPTWERAMSLPDDAALDDAADIVRLLDKRPGLDQEEIADELGLDHWRTFEITNAMGEAGILCHAKEE